MKHAPAKFLLIAGLSCSTIAAESGNVCHQIGSQINWVDAKLAPYNQVLPGDTLCLMAGLRGPLLLDNLTGSAEKPIIIINRGGVVDFNTDSYYGISIRNCSHFRLTGTGDPDQFYGIRISRVAAGAGIGIGAKSTDMELDHLSIENTSIGGIYAKTDPDIDANATRDSFTQRNTLIHDNYLDRIGNEGLYIGSTKYLGETVNHNGKDTLIFAPLLDGVRIYDNVIHRTGWDGIQVSSASTDCKIFGNIILWDSQAEYYSQMSGIIIGGGSRCDCYNNYISQGKGNGIESHGLGGYRIFNNIIVDAGHTYLPNDSNERKYGIFVSDVTIMPDSSVNILFNDIIRPKSDGIRFQSVQSKNNRIAGNLIIDPGNFDYYEHGNTSFKGIDAYVMIPNDSADVHLDHNYFTRDSTKAGIRFPQYIPVKGSPLIDAGPDDAGDVNFDFLKNGRPSGLHPDIGAIEYLDPGGLDTTETLEWRAYPNPVSSWLTIGIESLTASTATLRIYAQTGALLMQTDSVFAPGSGGTIRLPVSQLPAGLYLFTVNDGTRTHSGKFVKKP